MKVFKNLKENIGYLYERLPLGDSFDIIGRNVSVGLRKGFFVFVDGFAKDDVMIHVMKALQELRGPGPEIGFTDYLISCVIPYIEAEKCDDFDKLFQFLLSGAIILFTDNENAAIILDVREYPVRSVEEADTEKVTNGSKDGFVETIVFNTALIRRRVRDENLRFELKTVGESSKTDVCLAYIKGRAGDGLVTALREKLDSIKVDSLVMAEKSLEELLVKKRWFNPFPQLRYTQRPDIAASYLYEGHVLIMVDTSPSVMIAPTTFFYFVQFAEDYNQTPIVGTYYKLARITALFTAGLLIPFWLLLAENPQALPEFLSFVGAREQGTFSLFIQFLVLEIGFDFLKMSSMHTPTYLGGAFGIIGGLLLGDFAIKVGFFIPETIFYMALTIVASYCIPNSDLTYAVRIIRLFLLILTGFFGIYGFMAGMALVFAMMLTTKTLDKSRPYLWPLIPFNGRALAKMMFRKKSKA